MFSNLLCQKTELKDVTDDRNRKNKKAWNSGESVRISGRHVGNVGRGGGREDPTRKGAQGPEGRAEEYFKSAGDWSEAGSGGDRRDSSLSLRRVAVIVTQSFSSSFLLFPVTASATRHRAGKLYPLVLRISFYFVHISRENDAQWPTDPQQK